MATLTAEELARHLFPERVPDDRIPRENDETRICVGDGSGYLKTPGLIEVFSVAWPGGGMPLFERREFPTDHTLMRLESHDCPLMLLTQTDMGETALRRSIISNDGVWQKGVEFFVKGVWAKDPDRAAGKKGRSGEEAAKEG